MTEAVPARVDRLGRARVRAPGSPQPEASQVARAWCSRTAGHDSHGIGLVPQYVANVAAGHAVPGRKLRIVNDAASLVTLDGGKGFGQVMGEAAMDVAIERARAHGCAVVGLANTHHLGRIGQWGEQCALAGLVSVHFVNVRSRPLVAPWEAATRGCPPIRCAWPCPTPHPIVLDYATASVALGRRVLRWTKVAGWPTGYCSIAPVGRPTTRVMWGETVRRHPAVRGAQGLGDGDHLRNPRWRAFRRRRAGRCNHPPDAEQHADAGLRSAEARYGGFAAG
jgi:uncharacterized oxidoreductase